MNTIILTVTDQLKSFYYDLEVPTDLAIEKLKEDMAAALNGYDPQLFLKANRIGLFDSRIGKRLKEDETMESAGVWNGDYIIIQEG